MARNKKPEKIAVIRVRRKALNKLIQRLAFRYGFKWNDGFGRVRECGENGHYLKFNFTKGTIEFLPFFAEVTEYVEFDANYEVENEFDIPAPIQAFKNALKRNKKKLVKIKKVKMLKPRPKYKLIVKKKGTALRPCAEQIMDEFDKI